MNVSKTLAEWYDLNKRTLPWRESGNPYFIWLSEIILQQTRVQQGITYYYKFIKAYPTVYHLAGVTEQEILKMWQGLGYYSRARNLYKTACLIVERHQGEFPNDYKELRKLPGIGDYTAGAIISLAFNKPHPAIDGNVFRVLSRFFGISTPINSGSARQEFHELAVSLLDRKSPGRHNQAMIELGALICLPRNPKCEICVIGNGCHAFRTDSQQNFPVKLKGPRIRNRYVYYLVIRSGNFIFIRQRKAGDIWAMMFDFPGIETPGRVAPSHIPQLPEWDGFFKNRKHRIIRASPEYKHILSHQVLHAFFIEIDVESDFSLTDTIKVNLDQMEEYPLPRLIDRYLSGE
jgi:A/G-specific adenine glycosylase